MLDADIDAVAKRLLKEQYDSYLEEFKYVDRLRGSEVHWFFVQGLQAIRGNLYLPGVCSLLNGIEASLRVTIEQLTTGSKLEKLSPYQTLSNTLIRNGQKLGMPVEELAFPGETNFLAKLATEKHKKVDVEVVRQRNNLCHGNVFEYINRDLGVDNTFFTPECLREFAEKLLGVSDRWTHALGGFRKLKRLSGGVEDDGGSHDLDESSTNA